MSHTLELNDYQKSLRGTFIATLVITIVFVFLRLFVRAKLQSQFSFDDWFLVAAITGFSIQTGLCLYGLQYGGFGRKTAELTPAIMAIGLKYQDLSQAIYNLSLILTKLSIALLQLRIIGITQKPLRILHWISMGINVVVGVSVFLIFLFNCYLVGATKACKQPSLVSISIYIYSAFNILLDWYYAFVIVFLIWKLQNTRHIVKVSTSMILGMGLIASIAPIVRLKYVLTLGADADPLYEFAPIFVWSWIEECLALSAASIATFRPLIRYIPGLSSSNSGSNPDQRSPFTSWKSRINARPNRRGHELSDLEYTVHTVDGEATPAEAEKGRDGRTTVSHSSIVNKDGTEVRTFPDDSESQKSILNKT